MNDRSAYAVHNQEYALVSDISGSLLYKADDGKSRTVHLPLVTMCAVEPLAAET